MRGADVATPAAIRAREAATGLDRRAFLRLAGSAAAVGLLPAGCGGPSENLAPPPGPPLRSLTPRTYAVFTAATLRLMGPGAAAAIRAGRLDAGRVADAWLANSPALEGPLSQALLVLEFGFYPLVDKLRPFTRLDPAGQDRVLEGLMRSRMDLKRTLFKGLKAMAALSVYADPAGRDLAGYPGPFGNESVALSDAMAYPPSD